MEWWRSGGAAETLTAFLQQNSYAYWSFRELAYDDGDTIAEVVDKSDEGINLSNASPATSPNVVLRQVNGEVLKAYRAEDPSDFLMVGDYLNRPIDRDHEIIFTLNPTNNGPFIIGSTQASPLHNWRLYFSAGKLVYHFRTGGFNTTYTADVSAIASNGEGFSVWRLKFDFTNDVFKIFKNGIEQAISLTSGTPFSAVAPVYWNKNAVYPAVGSNNLDGSLSTTTEPYYFTDFIITPILTDEIAAYIQNLFTIGVPHPNVTSELVAPKVVLLSDGMEDLYEWWDVQDLDLISKDGGNAVASITGKIKNLQLTESTNKPIWTAADANGLATIVHNGTNQKLGGIRMQELENISKLTIIIVSKVDTGVFNIVSFDTTTSARLFVSTGDVATNQMMTNGTAAYGEKAGSSSGVKVTTYVFDGTLSGNANRLKVYENGVQLSLTFTGTIPATTPNNSNMRLSTGEHLGSFFNSRLGDILIYTNALSDANREDYEGRLMTKYGIS